MKQRHIEAYRQNALAVFASLNISASQDFFTLSNSQVCGLLEEADRVRYQKPRNANGSRARYFYARLQRQIRRDNVSNQTKHTPGPWEVDSGMVQTVAEHKCKTPGCGVHIPIAYMDRKPGNGTEPCERDANARLIAAAPELLEVCGRVG